MRHSKSETTVHGHRDRISWVELTEELVALEEEVRQAEARIVRLRRHLAAGPDDVANAGPPSARAA